MGKRVLDYLNISEKQLPEIAPPTMEMPKLQTEIQEILKLKNDISFVLGGADGPLSNLGLGAFGEDIAALTVRTSGAIRFITRSSTVAPRYGDLLLRIGSKPLGRWWGNK